MNLESNAMTLPFVTGYALQNYSPAEKEIYTKNIILP